jgi:septal ring factor EnvC (AmiA/AmiB activator)
MSTNPSEPSRRRPTGWIVLSCVLAATAIGLGIWAFNAQSDADDAQAKLASQAATASTPEPTAVPTSASTPAATSAPVEVDPATQQQFEQVVDDLGATSESVDQIDQALEQAATKVDSAEQARENATGALDKAKAEVEAISARFELTRTCMQGTLGALGAAFESGGLEATVQQLQKLSGSCASSESP